MKHLVYIFLILPVGALGQLTFNFESGFPDAWCQPIDGRWDVTDNFPIQGSRSMQHVYNNSDAGSDFVYFTNNYTDSTDTLGFGFSIRHGYPPSSLNNWQLVLLADEAGQTEKYIPENGIIFGLNLNASDDLLKIWQQTEDRLYMICGSDFNYQELVGEHKTAIFRIIRFPNGIWEINFFKDYEAKASDFETIARGEELSFSNGRIFGFRYSYSASQDSQLWIDDVKLTGRFYQDTRSPSVDSIMLTGLNKIELVYSEPVAAQSRYNYLWEGMFPDSIRTNNAHTSLFYTKRFPNRVIQSLKVSGIQDISGNRMPDTVIAFRQSLAEFGDIVISEIFYDPKPEVYLPPCEYIEVFNRYDSSIQIKDWTLEIKEREYILPEGEVNSAEFMVFTSDNSDCIGLPYPSLPVFHNQNALPNSGGEIKLFDQYKRLVHMARYNSNINDNEIKNAGGWSLESIDLAYLCGEQSNWDFSQDAAGGTPGKQNSVAGHIYDTSPPILTTLGITDSAGIALGFSEPVFIMDDESASFSVEGYLMHPEYQRWPYVDYRISLKNNYSFREGNKYKLILEDIEDCSGNIMESTELNFALPEIPEKGQVLINEIMYDPLPEGVEYIELYNKGPGWIDLYDLYFAVCDPGFESDAKRKAVSGHSNIIAPETYVVICRNSSRLVSQWSLPDKSSVFQPESWITLPNDGSCVSLFDRSGRTIDATCYNDSMHNILLASSQGISLERVSTSACVVANQCWTSASGSSGYGTPGERNSQFFEEQKEIDSFRLSQQILSPDHDGYEDILYILPGSGLGNVLVDIFITDLEGLTVKEVIYGGNPGSGDIFSWDGKDYSGNIVIPGIYIVHCRQRGLSGTNTERIPFGVIYQ